MSAPAPVDPAELRAAITALLAREATVTLATAGADGRPWAATVFFAADDGLTLYFVTDPRTRHGRDLAADARVAGTVQPAVRTWDDVLGVQLEGRARVLDGAGREQALAWPRSSCGSSTTAAASAGRASSGSRPPPADAGGAGRQ